MRILFFSHYFPPEGNAPASRTYEHCLRWARAGHQVTVVTCVPNVPDGVPYPGYRNRFRTQRESIDGIKVLRVWTLLAANSGFALRILNYLSYMVMSVWASLFVARPDVIVATSPQFFCGWAGVLASWLRRRPLVLEIRDIWPESITAVGAMKAGRTIRVLEWLEKRMYRAATTIVAVGEGYRDNIVAKIGSSVPIHVITNGVDLRKFQPAAPDSDVRARWDSQRHFVCAYLGTVGMAHGLEVVLRAAQLVKERQRDDIRFWIVGDGAERQRLEAMSAEMQVQQLVRFTGRQPREDMPRYIASSDACLVHLRGCELFENVIPSKIFEFMAMQRPIIMGVLGGARELVRQSGAAVEIAPDDAAGLADTVMRLADDRQHTARLALQAREYVERHFDRDQLAAQYLALLSQVTPHGALSGSAETATWVSQAGVPR